MTDIEIVQSAIGEKIPYHGHGSDYTVTEIYRNHVVLTRAGSEDEMMKIPSAAKLIVECRKIIEANKQPGIEAYFEKFGPINWERITIPNEESHFYVGRDVHIADAGLSMRAGKTATRIWGDEGNGFSVMKRNFNYHTRVGGYGYSHSGHEEAHSIEATIEFQVRTESSRSLKVEGDVYTPEKSGHSGYAVYFRNYDNDKFLENARFFNQPLHELGEELRVYSLDRLKFHAFEDLGDTFFVKQVPIDKSNDNFVEELWITDTDEKWVIVISHTTHKNDYKNYNSGHSKIKIDKCNMVFGRKIRFGRSKVGVPKRLTSMTKQQIEEILERMVNTSIDAFIDPNETKRLRS